MVWLWIIKELRSEIRLKTKTFADALVFRLGLMLKEARKEVKLMPEELAERRWKARTTNKHNGKCLKQISTSWDVTFYWPASGTQSSIPANNKSLSQSLLCWVCACVCARSGYEVSFLYGVHYMCYWVQLQREQVSPLSFIKARSYELHGSRKQFITTASHFLQQIPG